MRKKLQLYIMNPPDLPTGYTELEYLESPSTPDNLVVAYFVLPLPAVTSPNDTIMYETEHMFLPKGTIVQGEGCENNTSIFGIGNHGDWGKFVTIDGILNNPSALGNAYADWNISFSCTNYEFHTLRHYLGNEWQLTIDGSLVVNEILEWHLPSTPKRTFYLFGAPQTSQVPRSLCGKKRTAKIWVNGELLYDLIPVLDETGTSGFFDKISRKFFHNQGAGQFLYKIK